MRPVAGAFSGGECVEADGLADRSLRSLVWKVTLRVASEEQWMLLQEYHTVAVGNEYGGYAVFFSGSAAREGMSRLMRRFGEIVEQTGETRRVA